jgi:hypothetical protein
MEYVVRELSLTGLSMSTWASFLNMIRSTLIWLILVTTKTFTYKIFYIRYGIFLFLI